MLGLRFVVVVLAVLALGAVKPALGASPARPEASSRIDTLLDAIGDVRVGGGSMGFGVDVSPLRPWSPLAPAPGIAEPGGGASYRLIDPGTAISFDLKLRWPSVADPAPRSALQPYMTVGPALIVPETTAGLVGPVSDRPITLGLRAGAGLSWQVDPHATLFGEYRFTRGGSETLLPFGGKSAIDVGGFDLLYGVRIRF
jgi:hypothetical protein